MYEYREWQDEDHGYTVAAVTWDWPNAGKRGVNLGVYQKGQGILSIATLDEDARRELAAHLLEGLDR